MGARQTSIDCYNKIKASGLLSRRRFEVYECLLNNSPATAGELCDLMGGSSVIRHGSVNGRLTELRQSGAIQEVGTRICKITGMNVIEWDLTDRLPIKVKKEKTKTKKEKVEDVLAMIKILGEKLIAESDKDDLRKIYFTVKDI